MRYSLKDLIIAGGPEMKKEVSLSLSLNTSKFRMARISMF